MSRDRLILVGTSKGLFLLDQNNTVKGPYLEGTSVPSVAYDPRRKRILAGATSFFFGSSVRRSDDMGETWAEAETPNIKFPEDTDTKIVQIWQVLPAGADQPDVVYAGVEPAALFRSADGGESFEFVRGLWDHPHRPTWQPGGGGLGLHTILLDPRDPQRILIAISTGGVYLTDDGGQTWRASNKGIRAEYNPEDQRFPEYGQCVHKVARDGANPDQFFLQNHFGLYRSSDGAATWEDVANGVPSDFGFPVVAHPGKGDTAFIIPLIADVKRWTADAQCRVYRTTNAGASWEPMTCGLPQQDAYVTVLRDAFTTDGADPAGFYFGTRGGQIYASHDDGQNWETLAEHLPPILSVRAATL
jgi:BNR/Asp-box repeat